MGKNLLSLFLLINSFFILDALGEEKSNFNNNQSDLNSLQPELISPNKDFYILGPGDEISIRFGAFEKDDDIGAIFPTNYLIDNDGNLYLPRLKKVYVEGLTVKELSSLLSKEYDKFMLNPNLIINVESQRKVGIYIFGELANPGYYEFQSENLFRPTVFDAIKSAGGITPYSKLENIKVIRKLSRLNNEDKVQTNVNLMATLIQGDSSQNIKLYDQDYIYIEKSESLLKEKFLKAYVSNMNPQFIKIFVSGRVKDTRESYELPRLSTLNQAISVAGGIKPISGSIQFFRLTNEGIEKRRFKFKASSKPGSYKNPYLQNGDTIRVGDSLFSNFTGVLSEVTEPVLGIFALDQLFNE